MSYAGDLEIMEGRQICSTDLFSKQDPYVKLILDSQQIKTKTHHKGGKNPVWNQTLNLTVLPGQTVIKVECWDQDTMSDDLIGEGSVNLDNVFKTGQLDTQVDLRSKNGANAGQIRLVLFFKSKNVSTPTPFQGQTPYQNVPVQPSAAPVVMQMPPQQYQYAPAPAPVQVVYAQPPVQVVYAQPQVVYQQPAYGPPGMPPTRIGFPGA